MIPVGFQFRAMAVICDTPGCGYWENVPTDLESYDHLLNKPCPNCGANMVTEDCFTQAMATIAGLRATREMLDALAPADLALVVQTPMRLTIDHEGDVTLSSPAPKNADAEETQDP